MRVPQQNARDQHIDQRCGAQTGPMQKRCDAEATASGAMPPPNQPSEFMMPTTEALHSGRTTSWSDAQIMDS